VVKRCASGSWLPGELRGTNIVVLIVVIAAHHSRSPPQSYARLPKLHAGFPRLPQNELAVESRDGSGIISRQKFNLVEPRDSWLPWIVSLPKDSKSFRL
ncbi:MAG: hypothetical protein NTX09_15115, partial [Verrucomicrobia bacterium]|nr:hypothetical protein [Verrucomicrobiota bacterium]